MKKIQLDSWVRDASEWILQARLLAGPRDGRQARLRRLASIWAAAKTTIATCPRRHRRSCVGALGHPADQLLAGAAMQANEFRRPAAARQPRFRSS
jgi:hypothetical protein